MAQVIDDEVMKTQNPVKKEKSEKPPDPALESLKIS